MRFNKANVVSQLRDRAAWYEKQWGFTDRTGTFQLQADWIPPEGQQRHLSRATKAELRQQRAVAYGEWDQCRTLADWIEEGSFPKEN